MATKEKPYVLLVAELIYLDIFEIKKKNPEFSNINAIESFIGTETYKKISSGKFHDELILELKSSNLKVQYNPYSEDDARAMVKNRIGSRVKAEKDLGFKYKYELREGLQKLIEWRIATGTDKAK